MDFGNQCTFKQTTKIMWVVQFWIQDSCSFFFLSTSTIHQITPKLLHYWLSNFLVAYCARVLTPTLVLTGSSCYFYFFFNLWSNMLFCGAFLELLCFVIQQSHVELAVFPLYCLISWIKDFIEYGQRFKYYFVVVI